MDDGRRWIARAVGAVTMTAAAPLLLSRLLAQGHQYSLGRRMG